MNKLKKWSPNQVKLDFTTIEGWLKIRGGRIKDTKCSNCNVKYEELTDTHLALATFHDTANKHVCNSCGNELIKSGAIDVKKIHDQSKATREELIASIISYDIRYSDEKPSGSYSYFQTYKLGNKKLDEVKKLYDELKMKWENDQRIKQEIEDNYVETPTDQYLIDDHGLIESEYIKHPDLIERYFMENSVDYFDCGQGYYEDEVTVYVKIGDKYYNVTITAEITSQRMDRGDRVYWVENIESVTYEETVKYDPIPRKVSNKEVLDWIVDKRMDLRAFTCTTEELIEDVKNDIRNAIKKDS